MAGTLADLAPLVAQLRAGGYSMEEIPGIISRLGQGQQQPRLAIGTGEVDRELQARQIAETGLGNRAGSALDLMKNRQDLDLQRREEIQNPFKLVQYLANTASLPAGTGNPLQQLIGEGRFIQPSLPSFTSDPRYGQLEQSAFDYANPKTFQSEMRTDPNIARVRQDRATYGDQATSDAYARLAAAGAAGGRFAGGGTVVSDEPMMGMGMMSGRPRFLLGEEGPEKMKITPMATGGQVTVNSRFNTRSKMAQAGEGLSSPEQKAAYGVQKSASDAGAVSRAQALNPTANVIAPSPYVPTQPAPSPMQPAPAPPRMPAQPPRTPGPPPGVAPGVGDAPQTGAVSERQGGAIALGQALQNNPFASREMVADLLAGRLPRPGSVTPNFLKMFPTFADTLYGLTDAFGTPRQDYAASIDQFRTPGFSSYSRRFA